MRAFYSSNPFIRRGCRDITWVARKAPTMMHDHCPLYLHPFPASLTLGEYFHGLLYFPEPPLCSRSRDARRGTMSESRVRPQGGSISFLYRGSHSILRPGTEPSNAREAFEVDLSTASGRTWRSWLRQKCHFYPVSYGRAHIPRSR
jgi:hypothetical protein